MPRCITTAAVRVLTKQGVRRKFLWLRIGAPPNSPPRAAVRPMNAKLLQDSVPLPVKNHHKGTPPPHPINAVSLLSKPARHLSLADGLPSPMLNTPTRTKHETLQPFPPSLVKNAIPPLAAIKFFSQESQQSYQSLKRHPQDPYPNLPLTQVIPDAVFRLN